jgi:hypothetical protein
MMDLSSTSETSVNFCQTARRSKPQVSHLDTGRRDNGMRNNMELFFPLETFPFLSQVF